MALNLTQKIIKAHLLSGEMTAGAEIALRIDQTLKLFWSILTPIAMVQMIINLLLRGGLGL